MTELIPNAVATQKLSFYQKGTFTVGNRLVSEAERSLPHVAILDGKPELGTWPVWELER